MSGIPLSPFQTLHKRASIQLEKFFLTCENANSALLMDPGLDVIVSRLVDPNVLSRSFKEIISYQEGKITTLNFDKLMIFTTGDLSLLEAYVCLLMNLKGRPPREIVFLFSNRCNFLDRQYFENVGFLHRIQTLNLKLQAWILDPDFATLEMSFSFAELFVEGGGKCIEQLSHIVKSFPIYNHFTNVYMIGDAAIKIGKNLPPNFHSAWTHMIIFDRKVDAVTPFLTSSSYEAKVAEHLGLTFGFSKTSRKDLVLFNDSDSVAAQIRNLTFDEANDYAETLFTETNRDMRKGQINRDMTAFQNANLAAIQNVSIIDHRDLIEQIQKIIQKDINFNISLEHEKNSILGKMDNLDYIKEAITMSNNWRLPVRLLALFCLTSSNIPDLNEIRQMIIDKYGLEALSALWTLEESGIIVSNKTPSKWSGFMRRFKLFNSSIEKNSEKSYNGFTPVIVRIMQMIAKNQWSECQKLFEELKVNVKADIDRSPDIKRVLIVFVGGAMHGEMSSLHYLKYDYRIDIDVLTTQILSPRKLLDQLAGIDFT